MKEEIKKFESALIKTTEEWIKVSNKDSIESRKLKMDIDTLTEVLKYFKVPVKWEYKEVCDSCNNTGFFNPTYTSTRWPCYKCDFHKIEVIEEPKKETDTNNLRMSLINFHITQLKGVTESARLKVAAHDVDEFLNNKTTSDKICDCEIPHGIYYCDICGGCFKNSI